LTFANGSSMVVTKSSTIGSSGSWHISGTVELYFEYLSISTREALLGIPLLHLGSISLPYSSLYTLRIQNMSDGHFVRDVPFSAIRARGCAISVPFLGNYNILFDSLSPASSGRLQHDGNSSFRVSGLYDNFYSAVEVEVEVPPTDFFTPSEFIFHRTDHLILTIHLFHFLTSW
jgi:hypothetical protein